MNYSQPTKANLIIKSDSINLINLSSVIKKDNLLLFMADALMIKEDDIKVPIRTQVAVHAGNHTILYNLSKITGYIKVEALMTQSKVGRNIMNRARVRFNSSVAYHGDVNITTEELV